MRAPDFNEADWSVALDAQLDLYRWWATDDGAHISESLGAQYQGSYIAQERDLAALTDQPALALGLSMLRQPHLTQPLNIAQHERVALGKAATYFVSEEMTEMASWVARNMGDTINLSPQMIPQEAGFVWIDGGYVMTDSEGDTMVISAISWSTDAFDDPSVKAVDFCLYTSLIDPRDTAMETRRVQERVERKELDTAMARLASDPKYRTIGRTALCHIGSILFGARHYPDLPELITEGTEVIITGGRRVTATPEVGAAVEAVFNVERWLVAFWMLIDERITLVDHKFPGRAARRRFQREVRPNVNSPDETSVRTITLRRAANPTSYDDRSEAEKDESWVRWSHRWWVNPYWRVLHRGTDREKVVRVRGHVKGPEHAPLILRDSVNRWIR